MDKKNLRQTIFSVIERNDGSSRASQIYDVGMMVIILISIIPLMFTQGRSEFIVIERVTVTIFIIDYLLRWMTADYKLKKGFISFVLYPFTFMAIIDLLSIIPAFTVLNKSLKLLRMTRLFRLLRLLKLLRYTEKMRILLTVLEKEKRVLWSVLFMAVAYVFVTALFMFNVEPSINPTTGEPTFRSFFDALYWATVTLTTVGYGDICPVTRIGRFVSMISSLFGVAIIALPSGVITASYLDEIRSQRKLEEEALKKEEEAALKREEEEKALKQEDSKNN